MNRSPLWLSLVLLLLPSHALAQSTPGFSYGQVPTAGQWNAAFATKQDVLRFTPLNTAGGTMTGRLQTAPATINGSGFAILPGIAPTSPVNGDFWVTSTGFFGRVNNQTMQFASSGNFAARGANSDITSLSGLTTPLSGPQGGTGYAGVSPALDGLFSSTQGAILYRGASGWLGLPPGTAGQFLSTGGANANPSWGTPSGAGNVSTSGTPTAGQLAQFASATSIQGLAGALSVALGGTGSTTGALDLQSTETTIASAATTDIGSATTRRVVISGTTTITSFGTQPNRERLIRFTGALMLTYNATSLILPGAANITTAAGDIAYLSSDGSGNWTVREYQKADGTPLGQGGTIGTSGSFTLSGGLIVKWGSTVVTTDAGGNATISYPTAFPSATYSVVPWNGDSSSAPQAILSIYTGAATTAANFSVHANNNTGAITSTSIRVGWLALGK